MNRIILFLTLLFAIAGCQASNPLSEINVDPPSSEIELERERTRKLLETPPVSFRWYELEARAGLIPVTHLGRTLYLYPDSILENKDIEEVFPGDEETDASLMFTFSPEAGENLMQATSEPSELMLALVVEGRIELACDISSQMGRYAKVSGIGTYERAKSVASDIAKHIDHSAQSKAQSELFYKRLMAIVVVSVIAVLLICFVLRK